MNSKTPSPSTRSSSGARYSISRSASRRDPDQSSALNPYLNRPILDLTTYSQKRFCREDPFMPFFSTYERLVHDPRGKTPFFTTYERSKRTHQINTTEIPFINRKTRRPFIRQAAEEQKSDNRDVHKSKNVAFSDKSTARRYSPLRMRRRESSSRRRPRGGRNELRVRPIVPTPSPMDQESAALPACRFSSLFAGMTFPWSPFFDRKCVKAVARAPKMPQNLVQEAAKFGTRITRGNAFRDHLSSSEQEKRYGGIHLYDV